jgi:hypothetical protein
VNIFVYTDESGVFDKVHNQYYVFGGLVFYGKEERDNCSRLFVNAEKAIRSKGWYNDSQELKASVISNEQKGSLFRSLNKYDKFGVIIDQSKVFDSIFDYKKSKQRYLDFAYKIGLKRYFEKSIKANKLRPEEVEHIFVFVDEHTTATDGRYELRESLEMEFKSGTYSENYSYFFPPIFQKIDTIDLEFCNSEKKPLIRAADIIANNIYHSAITESYDDILKKVFLSFLPR